MLSYNEGDRVAVRVMTCDAAPYSWIAAWGQRGTVRAVELNGRGFYVEFDKFLQATGGWFNAEELEPISALDKLVEGIGD